MTDAEQKRILLIGIGRWGVNHLRILKSMPVELFVADHHQQRLKSTGVPESRSSMDPRSLFPKIDAAVVVTPLRRISTFAVNCWKWARTSLWRNRSHWFQPMRRSWPNWAETSGLVLQVGHIFVLIPHHCGCGRQSLRGDLPDSKCCVRDSAASNVRGMTPELRSPTAFILLISSTSFSEYCRSVFTP